LGSDGKAPSAYYRSKHRADEALRALPLASVVVQPSLVYAPQGASTTFFRQLAALPVLALPRTTAQIQPVHLDDLVEAVLRLVRAPTPPIATLAAVGPEAMTLGQYLARLRTAMGIARPAWQLAMPPALVLLAARLIDWWPGGLVD